MGVENPGSENGVQEKNELLREKRYKALIVFGFGAKPRTKEDADSDPEGQQDSGWHLTTGTKARVLAAAELWKMGEIEQLILSEGGSPENEKTGGQLMKEYLMAKYPEIPEEAIIVEDRASNTIENFAGTIDLLTAKGVALDQVGKSQIAMLSNRFHMARIKDLAERFGIEADSFNAEGVLEYAALKRDEERGTDIAHAHFKNAELKMSDEAGNEAWRDIDEVTRRVYLGLISKISVQSEKRGDREKAEEVDRWIALAWNQAGRQKLDQLLAQNGVSKDEIERIIAERVKSIGKTSYGEYLRQENRWSGGMNKMPSYWILQAAKVNAVQFRKILENPINTDALEYIKELGYDNPLGMGEEEFSAMKNTISSDGFIKQHRQLPPESWDSADPNYGDEEEE